MFGRGSGPEFNSINPDSQTTDETKKENQENPTDRKNKKFLRFFKRNKSIKEEGQEPEKEALKNSDSAGEVLVGEVIADVETPQYIKDGLNKLKTAKQAIAAVNEKYVLGQKFKKTWEVFKPALASAATGAVVRGATKFALKRALDFGTVGASAGAGAVVGGGMEFYKQNKAENRRLFNLETYNKTLNGYKEMSALEKAESYLAITEALKQRGLEPGQHAELSARLTTLKVALENKTEWESLPEAERLLKYMKAREQAEREELPKAMKKESGKILKDLFKDKNLNKNWKKISAHTLKGVVVGAGAGALGAWAFDHFAGSAIDSHHSAQAVAEKAAEAAKANLAHQAETIVNLPSSQDTQELHKTVWDTTKSFLQHQGVSHPSNADIAAATEEICKENNIEITGHHPGALGSSWYKGFQHIHKEGIGTFKDINLKDGVKLKGFDKLGDLIAKAGGTVPKPTEVKLSWPVDLHNLRPYANGPVEVSAARVAEALSSQDQNLRKIALIIGGGIAVAAEAMHYFSWQKKEKEKKTQTQIESAASPQEPAQPSAAQESAPPKAQEQTKAGVWDKINSKLKRAPVEKTPEVLKLESERKLEAAKKEAENLYLKENQKMQALEKFVYSYQAQTEPKAEKEEQYEKLRDQLGKIYNKETQMRLMADMALDEQKDFTEFWKNFTLDLQDRYQKAEARASLIWGIKNEDLPGESGVAQPAVDAGDDDEANKANPARVESKQAVKEKEGPKPKSKTGGNQSPNKKAEAKEGYAKKEDKKAELLQEMVDLGLMRADADKKNFTDEERIQFNKFVYLMQDKNTSLIANLYPDPAFKRKELASAFRMLKEDNSEPLKQFCRDALGFADQIKDKQIDVMKMLSEMKKIDDRIADIVDEEINKHKMPAKKRKK